jgi:RimJ/RimL family protein N-acetyltransferase
MAKRRGDAAPRAIRYASADAFLARAEPWLLAGEVENNVVLGLALARRGRTEPGVWFATLERGDELLGCALRTPPRGVLLTRAPRDALAGLLAGLGAEAASLPSVVGPEPAAGELAALWSDAFGRPSQPRVRQRLYELRSVAPFAPQATGALRRAGEADLDLLRRWVGAFLAEATPADPAAPDALARERLASGSLHLWEDGEPVAMAGSTGSTPNGVRVSLVYTPPALRGRGYAKACVAALSSRLLAEGRRYCCLYADLANPASNAVYRRIGYRPVSDAAEYELGGA